MVQKYLKIAVFIFSLTGANPVLAQTKYTVNFYGVTSSKALENMVQITQDLFIAQLKMISAIEFNDSTSAVFKTTILDRIDFKSPTFNITDVMNLNHAARSESIEMFAYISKEDDETWKCTIHSRNNDTKAVISTSKECDSYYKILTEAKFLIQENLSQTIGIEILTPGTMYTEEPQQKNEYSPLSLEGISGTWSGEKNISKIVLMKSGRGFIIFSNGASMNIDIKVQDTDGTKILNVKQNSKFNASFYPDIPRQLVLQTSENTLPIEWELTLINNSLLKGTKQTLGLNGDKVENTKIEVQWKKIN